MKVTPKGPAGPTDRMNRAQAYRALAKDITRTQGLPCVTIQYDIAMLELKVMGSTGTFIGATFRSSNPTPLLAEVLAKQVPIVIPNLEGLKMLSVSERLKQSGGKEFLDTERCSIIHGTQTIEYPVRLVKAALPIKLATGAVLILAIPSLKPSFPSQGLIMEHANSADRFDLAHIKAGENLARIFALETLELRFGKF